MLAAFPDGEALVASLATRGGDLEHKQALLVALVHLAQGAQEALGAALLWLGLWPGLDAVYRRTLRFAPSAHEVVSDLSYAFTAEIRRIDPARGQRLAATLVRNTERALADGRKKEWRHHVVLAAFPTSDDPGEGLESWQRAAARHDARTWGQNAAGLLEAIAPLAAVGHEREWFLQWLQEVAGEDAQLLAAVVVWDQTQQAAGRQQRLSHEAARKRFRRALARIRLRFVERMSQSDDETRVSVSEEGTHGLAGTNHGARSR